MSRRTKEVRQKIGHIPPFSALCFFLSPSPLSSLTIGHHWPQSSIICHILFHELTAEMTKLCGYRCCICLFWQFSPTSPGKLFTDKLLQQLKLQLKLRRSFFMSILQRSFIYYVYMNLFDIPSFKLVEESYTIFITHC